MTAGAIDGKEARTGALPADLPRGPCLPPRGPRRHEKVILGEMMDHGLMLCDLIVGGKVEEHLRWEDGQPDTANHGHQHIGEPLLSRIHGRHARDDSRLETRSMARSTKRGWRRWQWGQRRGGGALWSGP
jgi:hypothetical protein